MRYDGTILKIRYITQYIVPSDTLLFTMKITLKSKLQVSNIRMVRLSNTPAELTALLNNLLKLRFFVESAQLIHWSDIHYIIFL